MNIQPLFDAAVSIITNVPHLDPVTVITRDTGPNRGQIIIECYGKAWATFWGGMPEKTVREFVIAAHADYIVNRLVNHEAPAKARRSEAEYLTRIVTAIQVAFKIEALPKCNQCGGRGEVATPLMDGDGPGGLVQCAACGGSGRAKP